MNGFTEEEIEEFQKSIEGKYYRMTQKELDEIYFQERLSLRKQSGSMLDARKRNGYKSAMKAWKKRHKKRKEEEEDYDE